MTLDTLLSNTATTPNPDTAALAAARARLDDRIAQADAMVLAHRRRSVRRRRLSLSLVGAAAAAMALLPVTPFGGPASNTAQAAEVLLLASEVAAAQPDKAAGAAYWYSVSEYSQSTVDEGAVHRRESWVSRSGPGLVVDHGGRAEPVGVGPASFSIGDTQVDWDGLAALTTDPAELRALLLTAGDGSSRAADDRLFTAVGDLLRETPATPELRGALWRIASEIPGVTLVGDVTDAAGRTGTAVEQRIDYGQDSEVRRLVVDTTTGALLEETVSSPMGGTEFTYRSTYLDQGPADALPVQPQLPQGCTSFARC